MENKEEKLSKISKYFTIGELFSFMNKTQTEKVEACVLSTLTDGQIEEIASYL